MQEDDSLSRFYVVDKDYEGSGHFEVSKIKPEDNSGTDLRGTTYKHIFTGDIVN